MTSKNKAEKLYSISSLLESLNDEILSLNDTGLNIVLNDLAKIREVLKKYRDDSKLQQ